MPKAKRIFADISLEQHAKLKSFCALKGKTMQDYVIEAINAYLKKQISNFKIDQAG